MSRILESFLCLKKGCTGYPAKSDTGSLAKKKIIFFFRLFFCFFQFFQFFRFKQYSCHCLQYLQFRVYCYRISGRIPDIKKGRISGRTLVWRRILCRYAGFFKQLSLYFFTFFENKMYLISCRICGVKNVLFLCLFSRI